MIRSGSGVEAGKCSAGRGRGCSEHCQIPASWQVVSNLEPNRSRKKVRDDRFLYSSFLNIFKVVTNESQTNRPHHVRYFQNIANSGSVMKLEITSVSGFLYASSSYRVRPNSRHHSQALIKPNYRTRDPIARRGHFARAEILSGVKRRLCPEPGPRADLITEPVHGVLLRSLEHTYIWLKQQSLSHTYNSKLNR